MKKNKVGRLSPFLFPDLGLHGLGGLGVLHQVLLDAVLALADALAVHGEPGAGLLDHVEVHGHIDELAPLGDALAEHDVELGLAEGRRHLGLDDLDPDVVADDVAALLDALDPADVQPDGGVELQGVAAGGGLGVAVHDADLHAELVDEDDHAVGLGDGTRQLPEGLVLLWFHKLHHRLILPLPSLVLRHI